MSARPLPAPPLGAGLQAGAGLVAGVLVGLAALAGYTVAGPLALAAAGIAALGVIAMALFGVERVLVAAILLNLPLQLDVYLGYRLDQARLGALGGVALSVTTLALLGLLAHRAVVGARAGEAAGSRSWLPLAVFVAAAALSLGNAVDLVLGVYGLLLLLQSLLLFVVLSRVLRTPADIRWATDLLLVGLVVEALFFVLERVGLRLPGLLEADDVTQTELGGTLTRLGGTLGDPNVAGFYLSVISVIALAVVLSRPPRARMALAVGALLAGVAGLGATVSRGGLLAFGAGALTLLALAARRRLLRAGPLLVVVGTVGLLAAILGPQLLLRVSDDGGAVAGRLPLLAIAARMAASAPVFGVGVNNFAAALPDFVTPEFSLAWLSIVHNFYLQVAAEMGAIGLVAFLAFLLVVIRTAWRAAKGLSGDLAFLALGTAAAVVARMVTMVFDKTGQPVAWESLVIVAALAAVLHRQAALLAPVPRVRPAPALPVILRRLRPKARLALPPPAAGVLPVVLAQDRGGIPVGARLRDRYELGVLLGAGGSARVFRAQDLLLGREVAVKLLRQLPEPSGRRHMLRAAQAGARVAHPNLVGVHDIEGGTSAFLVLEVVEGRLLADLLPGGLPVQRAQVIADSVLAGLAALHAAGVTHREVTADNVLVDVEGTVRLTTAGLTEAASDRGLGRREDARHLEREVAAPSPEQDLFFRADQRSDVYAAGRLLDALLPVVPPAVRVVLDTATARDPRDRYPDAIALRAALREAQAMTDGPPAPAGPPPPIPGARWPRRRRRAAAVGAVGVRSG